MSMLSCYGCFFVYWSLSDVLTYFTAWTVHIQTISVLMTLYAARVGFKSKCGKALNNITYSLAIIFNLVVMSLYWTLIWPGKYAIFKDQPGQILSQVILHCVPANVCLINTAISNNVLSRRIMHVLLMVGVTYEVLNYKATIASGQPLYEFMHWRDHTTIYVCILINATVTFVYYALCKFDEFIKPMVVSKIEKLEMLANCARNK